MTHTNDASLTATSQMKKITMPGISAMSYKTKKLLKRIVIIGALLILLFLAFRAVSSRTVGTTGEITSSHGAIASVVINQTYPFNARTDKATLAPNKQLKMTITNGEINRRIIIKGQPATAREGKAFLILTVELENNNPEKLYLPVNELIRLQDGEKSRAPDVHNSLVLAEPISTKTTRVGFLVNADTRNFTLKVGEVSGAKQTIDLKL